jgi:hypothetical protein
VARKKLTVTMKNIEVTLGRLGLLRARPTAEGFGGFSVQLSLIQGRTSLARGSGHVTRRREFLSLK